MTTRDTTGDERERRLASGEDGGLDGTYLVEAGAGTGKTTVLVDRLLSLVCAGVPVSRIVAITFTDKAAAELRVRLRTRLEGVAGDGPSAAADACAAALRELDAAQVGTIHGFCSGMLRERPVEAGVDPDFSVVDELRRTMVLDEAWERWLREQLRQDLPEAVAQARALGFRLRRIRELAGELVDERDLLPLAPPPGPDVDTDGFLRVLEAEAADFERLARASAPASGDRATAAIARFAEGVRAAALLPDRARGPFILTRLRIGPGRNDGRKGDWRDGVLEDVRERVRGLRQRQEELRAGLAHNAAAGLIAWLSGYVSAYEDAKRAAGRLDFEDLLLVSRDLLRDNFAVREHFKASYDRILVDEFQDTDPLQCEIVFFLAERAGGRARVWSDVELEPGKLFLVGDPKQSIYRFRRADIETYEAAKTIIAKAGAVLELSENFRTRPAVVGEINAVFETRMAPPEDGGRYQPAYVPLVAHRPPDGSGPGVLLREPGADAPMETAAQVRAAEAAAAAGLIERAVAGRGLEVHDRRNGKWRAPRLGDVALLFHSTTGLEIFEDTFAEWGIDYRIAGGKRFYARREVRELATVLAAIENPHDLVAVVGALRSPFLGVSDDAIVLHRRKTGDLSYLTRRSGGDPAVERAFDLLASLHRERNSGSVASIIGRLFDETGALELFLLKPDGEQRHANLVKVTEIASALESTEPMAFGEFVRWLREVRRLAPEEAESPLSEEGDEFVRMLTIHKAKGLEFPIVVLADLANFRARDETIIADRERGGLEFGIGSDERRMATRGYEEARALERLRRDAERLRLLYVGLTRARDALVVPWFAKGRAEDAGFLAQLGDLRAGAGLRPSVSVVDAAGLGPSPGGRRPTRIDTGRARGIDPEATRAHRELLEWRERIASLADRDRPTAVVTPSRLASGSESEPVRDREQGETPGRAAALGTLVHAVLERVDLARPGDAAPLARAHARAAGLDEEAAREAADLATRALGSGVLLRARHSPLTAREVPFCVSRDGTVLEGKIDLVFEAPDGLVVVDYKTDAEPAGGWDALAERYRRQAQAYGLALAEAAGAPIAEIVLLFARGPTEVRVDLPGSAEGRARLLDQLLGVARSAGGADT